jgi:leucyl-tRNA synthetase
VFRQPWPRPDPASLHREEALIVVQVDGRVRGRVTVDAQAPGDEVRRRALEDAKVRPWLDGRRVEKVVLIPGRLVNIVTAG